MTACPPPDWTPSARQLAGMADFLQREIAACEASIAALRTIERSNPKPLEAKVEKLRGVLALVRWAELRGPRLADLTVPVRRQANYGRRTA